MCITFGVVCALGLESSGDVQLNKHQPKLVCKVRGPLQLQWNPLTNPTNNNTQACKLENGGGETMVSCAYSAFKKYSHPLTFSTFCCDTA